MTNASQAKYSHHNYGFTLLELMLVVAIISIIAAIAFPSYQIYGRKANESAAQQEIQKLAEQLERHKAKNFTYRGFDPNFIYSSTSNAPALTEIILPIGSSGQQIKYRITIRDLPETSKLLTDATARGRGWSIKAETDDNQNYSLLMTSEGLRCKTKGKQNVSYISCGANAGAW